MQTEKNKTMTQEQLNELKEIENDFEELLGHIDTTAGVKEVIVSETLEIGIDERAAAYKYVRLQSLNFALSDRMDYEKKQLEEILDRLHVSLSEVVL